MRVILPIVEQHAVEAPFLWNLRSASVCGPNYSLDDLSRLEQRLESHLDGLRIAGQQGWDACAGQLVREQPGELFTTTVLALELKHVKRIEIVLASAESAEETQPGLISGFGW